MRTASKRYDFALRMKQTCPGEHATVGGCAGPAELRVLSKAGTVLQSIDLGEAFVVFDEHGEPLVNSAELYDDQGTLNVGDFDFDGREDFAVQANQEGPYGGPTFSVFVQKASGERWTRSEALSRLTRENLGFFRVDTARKRLVTMSKSGCCWHSTEEHAIVKGAPVVVHRVVEDATSDDGSVLQTEETLVKGKWQRISRRLAPVR
jgi:hypothetical protein